MPPTRSAGRSKEELPSVVEAVAKAGYAATAAKGNPAEKPYEDIALSEKPYYAMRMAFIVGPCGELIEFVTELPNPDETES